MEVESTINLWIDIMKEIDCRNLNCPLPVVNTKKYFDEIETGEATIVVDNETAFKNVGKFAKSNGFNMDFKEEDGIYYLHIVKNENSAVESSSKNEKFTIAVGTDKLGKGDDKLGAILMKSYLFALSENSNLPTDMLFFNAGVKLTVKESESLDCIKKLQENGVNIQVCGTCLDFFNIKDSLEVGEVSNMYSIVETMNTSDKIITL